MKAPRKPSGRLLTEEGRAYVQAMIDAERRFGAAQFDSPEYAEARPWWYPEGGGPFAAGIVEAMEHLLGVEP